jgi:AbrB family looped-hinge helix DNA binding protein
MLAVKVLPKGQITIPKEVRETLAIKEGDTLVLEPSSDCVIHKKGKTIFDFIGQLPNKGMTIDEIREKAIAGGVGPDE